MARKRATREASKPANTLSNDPLQPEPMPRMDSEEIVLDFRGDAVRDGHSSVGIGHPSSFAFPYNDAFDPLDFASTGGTGNQGSSRGGWVGSRAGLASLAAEDDGAITIKQSREAKTLRPRGFFPATRPTATSSGDCSREARPLDRDSVKRVLLRAASLSSTDTPLRANLSMDIDYSDGCEDDNRRKDNRHDGGTNNDEPEPRALAQRVLLMAAARESASGSGGYYDGSIVVVENDEEFDDDCDIRAESRARSLPPNDGRGERNTGWIQMVVAGAALVAVTAALCLGVRIGSRSGSGGYVASSASAYVDKPGDDWQGIDEKEMTLTNCLAWMEEWVRIEGEMEELLQKELENTLALKELEEEASERTASFYKLVDYETHETYETSKLRAEEGSNDFYPLIDFDGGGQRGLRGSRHAREKQTLCATLLAEQRRSNVGKDVKTSDTAEIKKSSVSVATRSNNSYDISNDEFV